MDATYYDKGISLYKRGDTTEALKNFQKAASLFFEDKDFQKYDRTIAKMKKIGNTYTVTFGETLCGIARKIYGDKQKWSLLYQYNRDLVFDENFLETGWKLFVPMVEPDRL